MAKTLLNVLERKNNDYAPLLSASTTLRRGGSTVTILPSCSIVIPFFGNAEILGLTLRSIATQGLEKSYLQKKCEIILISDGTDLDISSLLKSVSVSLSVVHIRLQKNMGRAWARNVGAIYAKHEVVIYLDADMVVPSYFIASHLAWHKIFKDIVVVGFRENITPDKAKYILANKLSTTKTPDYRADFRYERFIPESWKADFPELPQDTFNVTCHLFNETDGFKKFGFHRTVGVWQLPYMVLSSNMSVRRRDILGVEGFDVRFKGWGLEDTYLAARLIAGGLYIIPEQSSSSFHVAEPQSEEAKTQKRQEFLSNLSLYNELLHQPAQMYDPKSLERNVLGIPISQILITRYGMPN